MARVQFEAVTRIDEADEQGADATVRPVGNPPVDASRFWESNIGFSRRFLPVDELDSGKRFDTKLTVSTEGPVVVPNGNENVLEAHARVVDIYEVSGNPKVELDVVDCQQHVHDLTLPADELPPELRRTGVECRVTYRISR